jgi:3-hydroxy-9,10-secoandrosta-1,3,5(10)-triene-9,17-dione monooxygenase reductase component
MADQLVSTQAAELTAAEWRAAMGGFPSGVTIVTTWADGVPLGSTISAFSSVSLKPPLLLVCLDLSNPLCAPIAASGRFGVNILAHDGQDLANRFAFAPERERFEGQAFGCVEGGAPRLDAAPVFIDCALHASFTAGDHLVVVGRGLRSDHRAPRAPLIHYSGAFATLASAARPG